MGSDNSTNNDQSNIICTRKKQSYYEFANTVNGVMVLHGQDPKGPIALTNIEIDKLLAEDVIRKKIFDDNMEKEKELENNKKKEKQSEKITDKITTVSRKWNIDFEESENHGKY